MVVKYSRKLQNQNLNKFVIKSKYGGERECDAR